MGLENKDISEEEKIPTSVWFSLGEYFLVGCGMTDRGKKKELSASITEFFYSFFSLNCLLLGLLVNYK